MRTLAVVRHAGGSAVWAALLAAVFVLMSVATPTWQVLVLLAVVGWAVVGWAAVGWSGDRRATFLFLFVLSVPLNLSKGLIAEGGVYSPGVSLFPSDLMMSAMFVLWLFDVFVTRRRPASLDPIHSASLLLLGWMWFSALRSEYQFGGLTTAIVYSKCFLGYFLVTQYVRTPRDIRVVAGALFVGLLLQFAYSSAQFATGSALEIQGAKTTKLGTQLVFDQAGGVSAFRPSGFLQHPNVLGDYLVFILPPALCLALLGTRSIPRGVRLGATAMVIAGGAMLVMTLSRGAWISAAVSLVVVCVAGLRVGLVRGAHVVALATAAAVGAVTAAALYPQVLLRITQSDARSSESRLVMMDQAMLIISRHPVLGVGLGGYNNAAQNNIPESFSHVSVYFQDQLLKGVVHNGYLLITSELGLIGMGLFLLLVWRVLALALPLRRWRSPAYGALAIGLFAAIIGQLVFHLFDHFYADIRHMMLWMFFGFMHALRRLHDNGGTMPGSYPGRVGA